MRWKEYLVLPAIFVTMIVGWIAWEATRARSLQEDLFRLPNTNDSLVLLDFIRQQHVDANENGQLKRTCDSIFKATNRLREHLPYDEVLPPFADLCQLHYRVLSALRLKSLTDAETQQLVSDFKEYMSRVDAIPDNNQDSQLLGSTITTMLTLLEDQGIEKKKMLDFAESLSSAFKGKEDLMLSLWTEQKLEGFTNRISLLGQPFHLKGMSIDGDPIDTSHYLGKIVLIEFWSTNCGPCISELPMLQKVYDRHKNIEIIGVSRDRSKRKLKKFLTTRQVEWPQLWHNPKVGNLDFTDSLGVNKLPSSILIDRGGIVVAFNVRVQSDGVSLESWIERLSARY